ncbi:MAG: SAM-dependent methyltransferase [Dehalococcoidia bacterium]|nr:SAM-dependent methyltransferase [Dehalococcoidia bacterium]
MEDGVEGVIKKLIVERGKITFAQFMEMALFSSRGGYYTSEQHLKEKDYYTAPVAHPVFGALVSLQLEQLWELMGSPCPFYVLEVGAGGGVLAQDVKVYSSGLTSAFSDALEYIAVDYNTPPGSPEDVHFIKSRGLPVRDMVGCVLSNELFDAFPVHRFVIREGRVKEIYVSLEEGELVEIIDEPPTPRLERQLSDLGLNLPEGFQGEVNLAMDDWIEELSHVLKRGFVLTFDYGYSANDLYSPARSRGTLRCYYRHVLEGNPYRRIGRQDITAHVDFSSLMSSGEEHGLSSLGFTTQREFLQNLGFSRFLDSLGSMELFQRERDANRMGMLELVKEGEMGDFKVLAQAKGLEHDLSLLGFDSKSSLKGRERFKVDKTLPPVPLLSTEHIDLMAGRYPHLSWEWEALWPSGKEE